MNLIRVFLGMFLDWIGILLLTVPIFQLLILEWGFDPVRFGIANYLWIFLHFTYWNRILKPNRH